MKTRKQCKENFEVIPWHCSINILIHFAIRLIIQNHKTYQMFQISGYQTKLSITIYAIMYLCNIISALLYLLHFLHNINHWFIHLLYIFCMMSVVRMWQRDIVLQIEEGTLDVIIPSLREKLHFLKEYKNEIFRLVLPHLNF